MIGATLAIGDFMLLLMTSVLWTAAGIGATVALYAGLGGGILLTARHFLRHRR
jgi:hypothetical protein